MWEDSTYEERGRDGFTFSEQFLNSLPWRGSSLNRPFSKRKIIPCIVFSIVITIIMLL